MELTKLTFQVADEGGVTRMPSHGSWRLHSAESATDPMPGSRQHTKLRWAPAASEGEPGRRELAFNRFQIDQQRRHAANTRVSVFYERRMGYRIVSITAIKRL
jgi:hypothetical protein